MPCSWPLGTDGLALSTIESYTAALRYVRLRMEPSNSCPSFHSPHMKILLRGINRVRAQNNPNAAIRLPITASLMRDIKGSLSQQPRDYDNIIIWAACCAGFFGLLCCGEFITPADVGFDPNTHLSLADVVFVDQGSSLAFHFNTKVSKTDQFRKGAVVVLAITGTDICPTQALLDYLHLRGSPPGPLFCTQLQQPCAGGSSYPASNRPSRGLGLMGANSMATAFALAQQPQPVWPAYQKP